MTGAVRPLWLALAAPGGVLGRSTWLCHAFGPASLPDTPIAAPELEFLGDWWTDGERRRESDRRRGLLLRAAEGLGAGAIPAGAELVREVGNPHGGLCVDVWHLERGGTSLEELRACLPIERTFVVELDDAPAAVDPRGLWADTIERRRLPGEGDLDVVGFVRVLDDLGWDGHWGVEVISAEHRSLPCKQGLDAAYRATQKVFDEA